MEINCQSCGAANDDQARFCDQCGTALSGVLLGGGPSDLPSAMPAPLAAASQARGEVNWFGIGVFALVLAAIGWLVFGGSSGGGPGTPARSTSSGQAPEQSMEEAQKALEEARTQIQQDPLDTGALSTLYSLYRQIGQSEKVRPYLDAALAETRKQHEAGTLAIEQARKLVLDMSMAAMSGDDILGALAALIYYYELTPERPSTALMIANIYYDIGMPDESLEWYDRYLADADPAVEGEAYTGAEVDRETMRMTIAGQQSNPELLAEAVAQLEQLAREHSTFWAARFNLGQGYKQQDRLDEAVAVWQQALPLAGSQEDRWRTEAAIAEAQGLPAPPMPEGMGMGMSGVDVLDPSQNPHAGIGMPPPSGGNGTDPHAGLGL